MVWAGPSGRWSFLVRLRPCRSFGQGVALPTVDCAFSPWVLRFPRSSMRSFLAADMTAGVRMIWIAPGARRPDCGQQRRRDDGGSGQTDQYGWGHSSRAVGTRHDGVGPGGYVRDLFGRAVCRSAFQFAGRRRIWNAPCLLEGARRARPLRSSALRPRTGEYQFSALGRGQCARWSDSRQFALPYAADSTPAPGQS